jgi:dTDP-4-dehydrorhamnose reductase
MQSQNRLAEREVCPLLRAGPPLKDVDLTELVIGGEGYIGSRLLKMIPGASATTRRSHLWMSFMDLANVGSFPLADIVYICAGVNGAMACEGNSKAYRVNVDGTVKLAQHYSKTGFVVWISSTTVEWSNSAYARMKQVTEGILRVMPNVGIVRAGRVVNSNVEDLCKTLIDVGRGKITGVTLWGEDEKPYDR